MTSTGDDSAKINVRNIDFQFSNDTWKRLSEAMRIARNLLPTVDGTNLGDGDGVHGESKGTGVGVVGISAKGVGVYAKSENGAALSAEGNIPLFGAITAINKGPGAGVWTASEGDGGIGICAFGKGLAGLFGGNVRVNGHVQVTEDVVLVNADCAEDFDISMNDHLIDPGTVMVFNQDGMLEASCQPYDKKVAGVISGAGGYKPGIVLDNQQNKTSTRRMPVALMGKVYCKVDATVAPIEVGDLLTTSSTEGHAMKASDPSRAFGAVIGKALKSLKDGRGMIPVLVALQ